MKTLREILALYKGIAFEFIEVRTIISGIDNEDDMDILYGMCSYIDNKLETLDGDDYSLDDKYNKWELWTRKNDANEEEKCLTVWFIDNNGED